MKLDLIKKISLACSVAALSITFANAEPYAKSQRVDAFQAKDQHDNAFAFKPVETRYLLVSHDMETGKRANGALTALGKDYLGTKKAIFMANIFGMPGIGRMFAMPKMKKYSHKIVIADDAALIAKFPQQAGKVSVLKLNAGKVESIDYWTPGTENVDGYLK